MTWQGFLQDNLETLDLEELQGVSGLKALRVGVNYMACDFFDEQSTKINELGFLKSSCKS